MFALLLAIAFQDPTPTPAPAPNYEQLVDKGVTFPADSEIAGWKRKGASYKKALEYFLNKATWTKALAAVHERTGLVGGTLEVTVQFAVLGKNNPGSGGGTAGKGSIQLDVEELASYWRRKEEWEANKGAGTTVVPPALQLGIISHELTHCFQGTQAPWWFLEGMATYVQDDPHFLAFFRNDKAKVDAVDADTYKPKHIYARGWGFFKYLEAKHGVDKMRKLIKTTIVDGRKLDAAAAEILGLEWEKVKAEEKEWTTRWVAGK